MTIYSLPRGSGVKYCDLRVSVCMFVCLFGWLSIGLSLRSHVSKSHVYAMHAMRPKNLIAFEVY